jgi:carbamoyl-phosphate synthase small subunit
VLEPRIFTLSPVGSALLAAGLVIRDLPRVASNFRSTGDLGAYLATNNIVGIAGIDTRKLTRILRERGAQNGCIHAAPTIDDANAAGAVARAQAAPSMAGLDLAKVVSCVESYEWTSGGWTLGAGYGTPADLRFHVVAYDFGVKHNILRRLAERHCRVTVVPAQTPADAVLAMKPDGVFLSNGPGDPAATGEYAVPVIRDIIDRGIPTFGICLGHQMLGIAVGAKTTKMHQGHHGANHPVKDLVTGKVEITSMNHGFAVDSATLPAHVTETHVSLFDGSNCGMALKDKPVFSVQYHPEASPGPRDSHYLFARFTELMRDSKRK